MSKHTPFIDRWAEYMKTHSYEDWKTIQNEFINAQYDMHRKLVERIRQMPDGEERLKKIFLQK